MCKTTPSNLDFLRRMVKHIFETKMAIRKMTSCPISLLSSCSMHTIRASNHVHVPPMTSYFHGDLYGFSVCIAFFIRRWLTSQLNTRAMVTCKNNQATQLLYAIASFERAHLDLTTGNHVSCDSVYQSDAYRGYPDS